MVDYGLKIASKNKLAHVMVLEDFQGDMNVDITDKHVSSRYYGDDAWKDVELFKDKALMAAKPRLHSIPVCDVLAFCDLIEEHREKLRKKIVMFPNLIRQKMQYKPWANVDEPDFVFFDRRNNVDVWYDNRA